MHDVIIVGGGPSGSFCGYHLARAGFHVAIVEKSLFPRVKLCGGGVSYKTSRLLEGVIDLGSLPGKSISGAYLCFGNEHLTYVGKHVPSYSVDRADLDLALLNAARKQGCEVFMPVRVEDVDETTNEVVAFLNDGKQLRGGFLVFAEGVGGKLFEKIGYNGCREFTMALQIDVRPKRTPEGLDCNALFDFGSVSRGYGWIFPKETGLNVGAYFHNSPQIDRKQERDLHEFINRFEWSSNATVGEMKGHPLPYHVEYAMHNTKRTILVGDLAGAVENFYGEGLFYGLLSSVLAASVLTDAMKANCSLDNYTRLLKTSVLLQVKFSRLSADFFYERQHFGYYRMVRNKLMNHFYSELIHGAITHRQCCLYTLLGLPISFLAGSLEDRDFMEVGLQSRAGAAKTANTSGALS